METANQWYTLIVKSENVILFKRLINRDVQYTLFNNINGVYASEIPARDRTDTIEFHRIYPAMSAKILNLALYIYPGHTQKLIDLLLKLYP
jgi:hypothetical protein